MLGDVNNCFVNFENKNFADNTQQCFAFTPQANFPANNEVEDDGIESRLSS